MNYKYIFGPVYSRRLHQSLGINFFPTKYCNMNCLFCECGATLNQKVILPSPQEIIKELTTFLADRPSLDYITFSGNGEPSLYPDLPQIIKFLKKNYSYPLALITNSSRLHDINFVQAISSVDLLLPSLHAIDQKIYQQIVQTEINLPRLMQGLLHLRKYFSHQIFLEIFVLPENYEHIKDMIPFLQKLSIDAIHLNSLDRPSAFLQEAMPLAKIEKLLPYFKNLPVQIIHRTADLPKFDQNKFPFGKDKK